MNQNLKDLVPNKTRKEKPIFDRRTAFTLVEILVVVAILALLSGLLFAVFSRVKNGSRLAVCANNLRQIGLASELYSNDNGGRYPNGPSTCAWADRLLPYTKNTSTFECPTARNSPYVPGCTPSAGTDNLDEFGQAVNFKGGYDLALYPTKMFPRPFTFKHPSSTILALDGSGNWLIPGSENLSDPETFKSTGIKQPRHQAGSNVVFLDGHVKFMTYDSLRDRALWNLGSPLPLN